MLFPLLCTSSLHHAQGDALGYVLVAPSGRVFKNSYQNLLKKVSILSAFRLLIFNTFKVKIVL